MGGSLIGLTSLSILYVSHVLSIYNESSAQAFYLSIFMIGFIPMFIIFGIIILFAVNISDHKKIIIIPILGVLLPLCFILPIS